MSAYVITAADRGAALGAIGGTAAGIRLARRHRILRLAGPAPITNLALALRSDTGSAPAWAAVETLLPALLARGLTFHGDRLRVARALRGEPHLMECWIAFRLAKLRQAHDERVRDRDDPDWRLRRDDDAERRRDRASEARRYHHDEMEDAL